MRALWSVCFRPLPNFGQPTKNQPRHGRAGSEPVKGFQPTRVSQKPRSPDETQNRLLTFIPDNLRGERAKPEPARLERFSQATLAMAVSAGRIQMKSGS